MEMSFTVGKSEARLVGLGHVEGKEVGSRGVNKILQKNNGKGMLLQIRLWDENEKEGGEEWETWVRQLRFLVTLRVFHRRGANIIVSHYYLKWDW